jgi:hypothetical protein
MAGQGDRPAERAVAALGTVDPLRGATAPPSTSSASRTPRPGASCTLSSGPCQPTDSRRWPPSASTSGPPTATSDSPQASTRSSLGSRRRSARAADNPDADHGEAATPPGHVTARSDAGIGPSRQAPEPCQRAMCPAAWRRRQAAWHGRLAVNGRDRLGLVSMTSGCPARRALAVFASGDAVISRAGNGAASRPPLRQRLTGTRRRAGDARANRRPSGQASAALGEARRWRAQGLVGVHCDLAEVDRRDRDRGDRRIGEGRAQRGVPAVRRE